MADQALAGQPGARQPGARQPGARQQGPGQQGPGQQGPGQQSAVGWFGPGWGRAAQPGAAAYPTGEPSAAAAPSAQPGSPPHGGAAYPGSQYQAAQYQPSQYPGAQYPGGGVTVLAPVPPAGAAAVAIAPPGVAVPGAGQAAPLLPGTSHPGAVPSPAAQPGALPPGTGQLPDTAPPADTAALSWDPRAEAGLADVAPRAGGPWPDICDQFGLHLLVLAEQLRASLDELESDEGDPERLRRLYQVDHAVTRMRRASRDLRTLSGRSEEELAGFTTSLLDVIRMAASAIERYTQVMIGRVTDLAVLGYAADDIGALMAALLDNATRYSPGTVTVSGHLLGDGGVMFRIEDTGIGIGADQVAALNTTLAGPVPDVDERTGRHTGFPVVHRIARKHSVGVRLAARPQPSSGTVAMVTLPPHLLCEVPAEEAQRRPAPAAVPSGQATAPPLAVRPVAVADLSRGEPTRPHQPQPWEPPELPDRDQLRLTGELPRRERASLRGDDPRPQPREQPLASTPEQQSAARRAFAEELSAFTQGASLEAGSARPAGPDPDGTADALAIEEEAKP